MLKRNRVVFLFFSFGNVHPPCFLNFSRSPSSESDYRKKGTLILTPLLVDLVNIANNTGAVFCWRPKRGKTPDVHFGVPLLTPRPLVLKGASLAGARSPKTPFVPAGPGRSPKPR